MEEASVTAASRVEDIFAGPDEPQETEITDDQDEEGVEAGPEEESPEIEEPAEPEDDVEASSEFVEVEFDGELYEVPPKLKDALMRESDYTQKTQEVAATKKQIEAEQARIAQERSQYEFLSSVQDEMLQVQQIEQSIPQYKAYLKENLDNLSATQIEKIRLEIDELSTQKDAITRSLQAKYQDHQQAQEQARRELLDKSTEVLRSKIPDYSEEKVGEYVKAFGFTDDQIAMAKLDPKQMEMAYKAMRYDQLQQGKTAAVAKAKAAPQIKAKSRNPMPKDVQDKLTLRKKLKSENLTTRQKQSIFAEDLGRRWAGE